MEFALFLWGGILDNLAGLIIIFSVFAITIRQNFKKMLLASVLIALPSYPLRKLGWDAVDVILHSLLIFIALRYFFRIPWLYAFLVMTVGHGILVLIQYLLLWSTNAWEINVFSMESRIFQVIFFAIIATFCYILRQKRLYFCFVPNDLRAKVRMTSKKRKLMKLSVFAYFLLTYGIYHTYSIGNFRLLLPVLLIYLGILLAYFFVFLRIEEEEG